MGISIVLAKLFGPYCLIVAAGVLFNLKTYQKMIDDLLKNSAIIYLAGVFALIFGLLIVQLHNVWVAGWPVIITVMGWLGLIKGVWLIVFPSSLPKVVQFYKVKPSYLVMRLVLVLALGGILTIAGYK